MTRVCDRCKLERILIQSRYDTGTLELKRWNTGSFSLIVDGKFRGYFTSYPSVHMIDCPARAGSLPQQRLLTEGNKGDE